ncbi:MAG: hypothetical protein FWG11_09475 [Promicromonosporaceae bacterium]|nr:hypothetical protein [Promicromonosporaceae bacterium]
MSSTRDLGHAQAAPDRYPAGGGASRAGRRQAHDAEGPLTGVGTLWRFMLRRDRTRILVWTASIGALYAFCVVALGRMFADPEAQQARAAIMRTPASVLMSGPGYGLNHYTLGPIMANELLLWIAASVALMSILQVVRHTRAEEESSRSELLRAQPLGRHAPTFAAVGTVVVANLAIAVVGFLALIGGGLPVASSVAYVLGVFGAALCFGAVALVFSQLSANARTASGLSIAVVLASVFVRGAGDMQAVGGSPLSWASPFGWAQQTRLYVELRWWPLLLPLAFALACLALAAALGARRDFGAGLLPGRLGRATAKASLRSPHALVWRQQRTATAWWGVGMFVSFLAMGTYIDQMGTMVSDMAANNPIVGDIFDTSDMVGSFTHIMFLFGVLAAVGYGISAVQRARGEESSGRLELTLATPVSRHRWLAANLGVPTVASAALVALGALGMFAGAASVGVTDPGIGQYLLAAVVYLPAMAVIVFLTAALFAWVPRLITAAWALVAFGFVEGMLGDALNLPGWLRGFSPLHWVPNPLATGATNYWPLVWLSLLAGALAAATFVGFRRRDVPMV